DGGGGPEGQKAGRVELDRHGRKRRTNDVELGQRAAELTACLESGDALLERPPRHAAGSGRNRHAQPLEAGEPESKPPMDLSQQRLAPDVAVLEAQDTE